MDTKENSNKHNDTVLDDDIPLVKIDIDLPRGDARNLKRNNSGRSFSGMRVLIEFCGEHPFATGLFAILSVIGLVLSIVGYLLDRSEAQATTEQITNVQEEIGNIRSENIEKQNILSIGFQGTWNDKKAFNTVWPEPRKVFDPTKEWPDRFERSLFLSLQGTDVRILLTSYSMGDCQGCSVVLSVFSFKKELSRWYVDALSLIHI